MVLVDTVSEAETAAASFVHSLVQLQSMTTGFDIDLDGLLSTIEDRIRTASVPPSTAEQAAGAE